MYNALVLPLLLGFRTEKLDWRERDREEESWGICVNFFSLSTPRMLSSSSIHVHSGCLLRLRTIAFVQAPPAPPGPVLAGSPNEDTSNTCNGGSGGDLGQRGGLSILVMHNCLA